MYLGIGGYTGNRLRAPLPKPEMARGGISLALRESCPKEKAYSYHQIGRKK